MDENNIKNIQFKKGGEGLKKIKKIKKGEVIDFSLLECRTYYNTIVIKNVWQLSQMGKSVEQK